VTANGEWPIVGAALGFPPPLPAPSGDPTGVQLSHCTPAVARQLQQLYQDTLRHFDQAYASSILSNSPQTSQSNLTQMSPHMPTYGLPLNRPLAQMAGPPPQRSTQIVQPPSQQPIQPHKIPPLPEDRFKSIFMQFTAATGLRLTDRDLVIEGRPVNLWALHRAVFMRNGFESVRLGMIDGSWL